MARILIEVPTYDGRISQATSESLWRLDLGGNDVDYRPRAGYGCAMARNRIAADAINAGYDYVMMVDNDISLPRDALTRLLGHQQAIVMGWYLNRYARGQRRLTTLYKADADGWEMYAADELKAMDADLIRVKGGGMGCCLIETFVFKLLPFPWFEWTDDGHAPYVVDDVYSCTDRFQSGGEDINFCNLARFHGITIHADPKVACGHEFREVVWP